MSNGTPFIPSLTLSEARAKMLLELLTQAAAKGPDAAVLGGLYLDMKTIVDSNWPAK
jgi:hypothetical protein